MMDERTMKLYANIWTAYDFLVKALKTSDPIEKDALVATVVRKLGDEVVHMLEELENELETV